MRILRKIKFFDNWMSLFGENNMTRWIFKIHYLVRWYILTYTGKMDGYSGLLYSAISVKGCFRTLNYQAIDAFQDTNDGHISDFFQFAFTWYAVSLHRRCTWCSCTRIVRRTVCMSAPCRSSFSSSLASASQSLTLDGARSARHPNTTQTKHGRAPPVGLHFAAARTCLTLWTSN